MKWCEIHELLSPHNDQLVLSDKTSTTPPSIQIVSILYTVIPCLLFAIIFSLVVIFICWRYHKQIIYQAAQTAATPLVPVVGKSSYPKVCSVQIVVRG